MHSALTAREFADLTGVSRETLDRLHDYANLLVKWQRKMNLVSNSTISDLWRRHMLDSAQLAGHIPVLPDGATATVSDLGSGAGFPGLVLAIVTGLPVQLFEADSRKCAFLREAVRVTQASATVVNERITTSNPSSAQRSSDVVVARALAPLEKLCAFAWPLEPRCCLFPKGSSWAGELTAARRHWRMDVEISQSTTMSESRILRISDIIPQNELPNLSGNRGQHMEQEAS